jgi:hypothetical protein
MNFDQPIKPENKKTPENKIKEGVDFIFEQNPELAQIGTKEQYSEYLDTIFPESKVRDIVYHGTSSKFDEEKFDKSKLGKSTDNVTNKLGFYFVPEKLIADKFIKGRKYRQKDGKISTEYPPNAKVFGTILNLQKPETIEGDVFQKAAEANILPPLKLDGDSLIITPQTDNILSEFSVTNYVVFDPDQIHILGSKQDLENFKNFVSKKKN